MIGKRTRWFIVLCLGVFVASTSLSCDQVKIMWTRAQADKAMTKGEYTLAIKNYKQLLKSAPDDLELNWNLGLCYALKNDQHGTHMQMNKLRAMGYSNLVYELYKALHKEKTR